MAPIKRTGVYVCVCVWWGEPILFRCSLNQAAKLVGTEEREREREREREVRWTQFDPLG